jgi:adenylate kinase
MAAGDLVADDVLVGLVLERLAQPDAQSGFVLDGFPRNLAQADALDRLLAGMGRDVDAILYFDLPDEVAAERMRTRAAAENRPDDTPEVIARRLEIYHSDTEPIVEHYRATGNLVPLHAERPIEDVWLEVQKALQRFEDAA